MRIRRTSRFPIEDGNFLAIFSFNLLLLLAQAMVGGIVVANGLRSGWSTTQWTGVLVPLGGGFLFSVVAMPLLMANRFVHGSIRVWYNAPLNLGVLYLVMATVNAGLAFGLASLLGMIASFLVFRLIRTLARVLDKPVPIDREECHVCGYDLSHAISETCSECGYTTNLLAHWHGAWWIAHLEADGSIRLVGPHVRRCQPSLPKPFTIDDDGRSVVIPSVPDDIVFYQNLIHAEQSVWLQAYWESDKDEVEFLAIPWDQLGREEDEIEATVVDPGSVQKRQTDIVERNQHALAAI